MKTFKEFCLYFNEEYPTTYAPIVDAYIQYEFDYTHGGEVSQDDYWHKKQS